MRKKSLKKVTRTQKMITKRMKPKNKNRMMNKRDIKKKKRRNQM